MRSHRPIRTLVLVGAFVMLGASACASTPVDTSAAPTERVEPTPSATTASEAATPAAQQSFVPVTIGDFNFPSVYDDLRLVEEAEYEQFAAAFDPSYSSTDPCLQRYPESITFPDRDQVLAFYTAGTVPAVEQGCPFAEYVVVVSHHPDASSYLPSDGTQVGDAICNAGAEGVDICTIVVGDVVWFGASRVEGRHNTVQLAAIVEAAVSMNE
jgi:hypothetical protein